MFLFFIVQWWKLTGRRRRLFWEIASSNSCHIEVTSNFQIPIGGMLLPLTSAFCSCQSSNLEKSFHIILHDIPIVLNIVIFVETCKLWQCKFYLISGRLTLSLLSKNRSKRGSFVASDPEILINV